MIGYGPDSKTVFVNGEPMKTWLTRHGIQPAWTVYLTIVPEDKKPCKACMAAIAVFSTMKFSHKELYERLYPEDAHEFGNAITRLAKISNLRYEDLMMFEHGWCENKDDNYMCQLGFDAGKQMT